MKISYNWLIEYLPQNYGEAGKSGNVSGHSLSPERLSMILTSVGLEVEALEKYEEFPGGLEGLVVGEVLECHKHPQADSLFITKVDIGHKELLQIICGASNVAAGQKVVVAPIGTTINTYTGEQVKIKKAKIRGTISEGMICAEDEIGIGSNHKGIIVLPDETIKGTFLKDFLHPYSDWVYEIGLTANRMDAMSHLGVARDVCAWLSLNDKKEVELKMPATSTLNRGEPSLPVKVTIENLDSCRRYSGISISGISVSDSPPWLQKRLKSIGQRPVNNIVDITNFVLHESGQPLHAFDLDTIHGGIMVKNLATGVPFETLDEKVRQLNEQDLMICDGKEYPLCLAGVFGGKGSGVSNTTSNLFIESAWFEPSSVRKTSLRHGLRTDAAIRFEKGADISGTVSALKRAASLILKIAGGNIASDIIDEYPAPQPKNEITLKNNYLKKISGKNYHQETVRNILQNLGFEILKIGEDDIRVAVPYNKPDMAHPADLIEEIMRIDGFDNIDIPASINIIPSPQNLAFEEDQKERVANYLVGLGFREIFTNSITNSRFYNEEALASAVKIMNSVSEGLDILRPSLLENSLERIEYNLNRKNNDLKLFEFGKVYSVESGGKFVESEHLCLYVTGNKNPAGWQQTAKIADVFYLKGVCDNLLALTGSGNCSFSTGGDESEIFIHANSQRCGTIISVALSQLKRFAIKQPVVFMDINWQAIVEVSKQQKIGYREITRFPSVERDLSLIVDKGILYQKVEEVTSKASLKKLVGVRLFDVFESEKIGVGKQSFAINFTFIDREKTLTDTEIDTMITKLITLYEKELGAEIRKT